MRWRLIPESWRWAATLDRMKQRQTVIVVTVRDNDTDRARHLISRLTSLCGHPQFRDVANYTLEEFPQAPPVPLEERER